MRDLLVLDFDGIVLLGAVVRVDRRGTVEIRRRARSAAATPEASLEEVLGSLGRTPAACAVRSAEVVAGIVRLPIASARGRSTDEIAQMLRWEIEPLHARQAVVPPLGAILAARGHLDPAQVERVLARVQERRAAGERDAGALRFGAVARELGLVTDAQLAEALAIQERLGTTEEEHVCGWAPPSGPPEPGGTPWLAAGMPAARRRFWTEELSKKGLRLLALYPRLPGAIAALDRHASATVLEAEPHAVSRSVVRDGALVSLEIVPTSELEPPADACRELLDGAQGALLCGSLADPALVASLGGKAGIFAPPVRGDVGGSPAAFAGLAGTARHAAGRGGPLAAVPARDPAPPLLRRTGVRWAAAILLVATAVLLADRLTARALTRSVRDLAAARERLRRVTGEIGDAERRTADAAALAKEIASLEEERDALSARRRMLEEGVSARARLLPLLLDALAAAASDEILLERTVEESPGRIRIDGRALSERGVQAFGRAVAAKVLPMRLRVVDLAIRRESRGGSYSWSLLLDPLPGEDA